MGVARAIAFSVAAFLPAILVGIISFWVMGGADQEWASWMWLPCYIVPGGLVIAAGTYGWKTDVDIEQG